jgi:hypothetical protein
VDFVTLGNVSQVKRLIDHWNSQNSNYHYEVEKTVPYFGEDPEDGWMSEVGVHYFRPKGRVATHDIRIAQELVAVAKLIANDPILESVVDVVAGYSFLSLRRPLESLGLGRVSMDDSGDSMIWQIKVRSGKTIGITSIKGAKPDLGDIVVGNFVVGYL